MMTQGMCLKNRIKKKIKYFLLYKGIDKVESRIIGQGDHRTEQENYLHNKL